MLFFLVLESPWQSDLEVTGLYIFKKPKIPVFREFRLQWLLINNPSIGWFHGTQPLWSAVKFFILVTSIQIHSWRSHLGIKAIYGQITHFPTQCQAILMNGKAHSLEILVFYGTNSFQQRDIHSPHTFSNRRFVVFVFYFSWNRNSYKAFGETFNFGLLKRSLLWLKGETYRSDMGLLWGELNH